MCLVRDVVHTNLYIHILTHFPDELNFTYYYNLRHLYPDEIRIKYNKKTFYCKGIFEKRLSLGQLAVRTLEKDGLTRGTISRRT